MRRMHSITSFFICVIVIHYDIFVLSFYYLTMSAEILYVYITMALLFLCPMYMYVNTMIQPYSAHISIKRIYMLLISNRWVGWKVPNMWLKGKSGNTTLNDFFFCTIRVLALIKIITLFLLSMPMLLLLLLLAIWMLINYLQSSS